MGLHNVVYLIDLKPLTWDDYGKFAARNFSSKIPWAIMFHDEIINIP